MYSIQFIKLSSIINLLCCFCYVSIYAITEQRYWGQDLTVHRNPEAVVARVVLTLPGTVGVEGDDGRGHLEEVHIGGFEPLASGLGNHPNIKQLLPPGSQSVL